MRRSYRMLVIGIAVGVAWSPGFAQSDGNAPLILELPASTRAAGLGTAYVLSRPGHDALFYNAATLDGAAMVGSSVARYGGQSTLAAFSAANEWAGGGFAIGLRVLSYSTDADGLGATPEDANDLLSGGDFAASEFVGSIAYGREVLGIRVGLVAKAIEHRIAAGRDATVAADVGVVSRVLGMTVGVSVLNLGPGLNVAGERLPLPRRISAGISTPSRQLGPLDVVLASAVSHRRDGEVIPAGGIEVSYWPVYGRTFTGRFGVRRTPGDEASPFTFGLAFQADDVTFEYAFEQFDAPGAAHRVGLSWR